MKSQNWMFLVSLILVVTAILGTGTSPLYSQGSGSLIDDFEGTDFDDRWWSYDDGSQFTCHKDSPGYDSDNALKLAFDLSAEQYPGCGMDIAATTEWPNSDGLRFVSRSDQTDMGLILVLNVEDPTQTSPESEGSTPFETYLQSPGSEWTQVTLPWNAFVKADWVGESGVESLDPSRVVELVFVLEEGQSGSVWIDDVMLAASATPSPAVEQPVAAGMDKFALWTGETQLRGVNTWQRVVVPDVDGSEFLGSGHVGPPYAQEDFDRLAALGANYVNVSGPGLFTETPPYVLDEKVQASLDNLLAMIARADMFAVISARTGPGRSDFTFYDDGIEEWGDPALVIDDVWLDQAAQDAWAEMWRHTAERYRDNPIVAGYDLMVEPNAPGRMLGMFEPDEFYPAHAGTLYDWNQWYPRMVKAIREVDPDTPILVGATGWSGVRWLPYLEPVDDPRTVYMVHQYEPQDEYTHQEPQGAITYPGALDLDWDGAPDAFSRDWLDEYLSIIDRFNSEHGAPVAVNEYGVHRWVPNAADFMRDSMELFELRGMNHAFWAWNPSWPPHNVDNDDFDFLHGPDSENRTNVATSELIDVILDNWSHNTVRPSNVGR